MKTHVLDFIQFRNPQQIGKTELETFFLSIPETIVADTHYYSSLRSNTFAQLKLEIVRRSAFFSPMSAHDLNDRFASLIAIFNSVVTSADRPNFEPLGSTEAQSISQLNESDIIDLWDNFAHYLWVSKNEDMQNLIANVLVSEKLLGQYREMTRSLGLLSAIDEKILQRILNNAKVVVNIPIANLTKPHRAQGLSSIQRHLLEKAFDNLKQRENLRQLSFLKEELVQTEATIRKQKEEKQQSKMDAKKKEMLRIIEQLKIDTDSQEARRLLTKVEHPKKIRVSFKEAKAALSPSALKVSEGFDMENTSASEVLEEVNLQLDQTKEKANKLPSSKMSRTLNIEGNVLTTEQTLPEDSWVILSRLEGARKINYYLVHFSNDQTQLAFDTITGDIRIEEEVIPVQVHKRFAASSNGFDGFLLNETPIEIASSLSVHQAHFSLDFHRTLSSGSNALSQNFNLFGRDSHFDVISTISIDSEIVEPAPLFGVERLEIVDFKRVEQEIACYVPGEVSHIENIMAREFKERISKKQISNEVLTEITDEFSSEQLSDTETTDRLEMQSQAESTMSEERSRELNFNINTSAKGKVGSISEASFTADFGGSFSKSFSQSESNQQSIERARAYTQKIQNKITQRRTTKRSISVKREHEDLNKHGFDNKNGEEHVVGVYRWVDKIYKNYLVNYGKRLTYEFVVPEPAIHLIGSQLFKIGTAIASQKKQVPPANPASMGLESWEDVNPENYFDFAAAFRLTIEAPPADELMISSPISQQIKGSGEVNTDHSAHYNDLIIPEGYATKHLYLNGHFDHHGGGTEKSVIAITVANETFTYDFDDANPNGHRVVDNDRVLPSNQQSGPVPIAVTSNDVGGYSLIVRILCKRTTELLNQWKLRVYNLIMDAYEDAFTEYESAVKEQISAVEKQTKINFNRNKNREIEQEELKLSCIKLLTQPFGIGISEQHYLVDHQPPHIIPWERLDKHADMAKFLESAFEWNLMAYTFYPYYYLHENMWYPRMNLKGGKDPLFESFLKAGFARIKVAVRKGYEAQVLNFLETGELSKGKPQFVFQVKNNAYASILNELSTADEEVVLEETWESKIPTTLTILQNNAGGLDMNGLPCNGSDNPIGTGESLLEPENNEEPEDE